MSLNRLASLLLCGALVLSLPLTAQACTCLGPPTLLKAFQGADVVLQATLIEELNVALPPSSLKISYSAQINRVWKGCDGVKGIDRVTITTSTEVSTCGVPFLQLGTTYLFSGLLGSSNKSVSINSCGFQAPWNSVNETEVISLTATYTNCSCTSKCCGPRPGLRTYLCPDGYTMAGPGACLYNQKIGACAWDIVKCPTCQQQSDCGNGQFCSAGICRALGTCATTIDCLNPQNQPRSPCNSLPLCKNSKCPKECSSTCPDGKRPVNCLLNPCRVPSCRFPNVTCTSNYCGGCHAYYINSSGFQVCTTSL